MATFETLEDFLHWAENYFETQALYYGHGTDNAWDEAVMLAFYVLQISPDQDTSVLNQKLTPEQQKKLLDLATRRVQEHIPIPYLTNEAWFAGERYYVNKDVIIPRSPIAEMIEHKLSPWLQNANPGKILDMCTGSGCIAIYIAKIFTNAKIDAVDISKKALEVAKINLELHGCTNRINLICSDLFTNVPAQKYDVIISNPPYVDDQSMHELPLEFRHEPELALASGYDGLDFTNRLLQQAKEFLASDGILIVEVGNSWHALEQKYPNLNFTWVEFERGGEGVFVLDAKTLRESI